MRRDACGISGRALRVLVGLGCEEGCGVESELGALRLRLRESEVLRELSVRFAFWDGCCCEAVARTGVWCGVASG